MTKQFRQLIHVLWAIEKDLHAIASNKEADTNQGINHGKNDLMIFPGLTLTGKPVSEYEYRKHYAEYLKRFSS